MKKFNETSECFIRSKCNCTCYGLDYNKKRDLEQRIEREKPIAKKHSQNKMKFGKMLTFKIKLCTCLFFCVLFSLFAKNKENRMH